MSKINEILNDIGNSNTYTLHAHTQFCDGRVPMEVIVKEAAHIGFTHLGFTPHSPIPFQSSCNMASDDIPAFFAEIDRLRRAYPQIKLYKAMEIDYLGDEWGATSPQLSSLDLDYSISSVHFIPTQQGNYIDIDGRPERFLRKLDEDFNGDLRYIVETFYSRTISMIRAGGFDILGHFDKIKLNASYSDPDVESRPWYTDCIEATLETIEEYRPVVEINTKSWDEYRHFFPAERHWSRLLNSGIRLVVNSDAHYAERINSGRPYALQLLSEYR